MALPSITVTQTPHSTLPHARQQLRTCFTSPDVAVVSSASAFNGATADELTAQAAPVTAIAATKLRRDMVSCAIFPHLSLSTGVSTDCASQRFPTRRPSCLKAWLDFTKMKVGHIHSIDIILAVQASYPEQNHHRKWFIYSLKGLQCLWRRVGANLIF
jgi:hypothetical protein